MKKLILGILFVISMGCQKSKTGSNDKTPPIPASICQQFADKIIEHVDLPLEAIVKKMVLNSNLINVSELLDCLDQKMNIHCQNNHCHVRRK